MVNILAAHAMIADLQYITAPALLKDYEVRSFPALVINGRVVLAGQRPPPAQLEKILLAYAGPGGDARAIEAISKSEIDRERLPKAFPGELGSRGVYLTDTAAGAGLNAETPPAGAGGVERHELRVSEF